MCEGCQIYVDQMQQTIHDLGKLDEEAIPAAGPGAAGFLQTGDTGAHGYADFGGGGVPHAAEKTGPAMDRTHGVFHE